MTPRASQSPRSRDAGRCCFTPQRGCQATPTGVPAAACGRRGDGPQGGQGERGSCVLEERTEPPAGCLGPRRRVAGSAGPGPTGRQAGPPRPSPHTPFSGPRAVPAQGRRAELVRPGLHPPRPGLPTCLAQGHVRGQCPVVAAVTKGEGRLGHPPPRAIGTRLRESLPPRGLPRTGGPPGPHAQSPRAAMSCELAPAPLPVGLTLKLLCQSRVPGSTTVSRFPQDGTVGRLLWRRTSACQGRRLR